VGRGEGGGQQKTRDLGSDSEHEDLAFGGFGGLYGVGAPRAHCGGAMTPR